MVSLQQLQNLMENDGIVVDQDGGKIGRVGQIYLDDQTNEPEWVTTETGLFGTSESFVPLQGAALMGNQLAVTYPKDRIQDAPRIEADSALSPEQEDELYSYYGLGYAETGNVDEPSRGHGAATAGGHDTVGQTRLRRFIVTEEVKTSDAEER